MPALSGMGFDWEASRVALVDSNRETVSEIVEGLDAWRTAISDSMAAMAGVIDGSFEMRLV